MKKLFLNERFIMLAIIVNTILIFIDGFWPESDLLAAINAFFTLIFAGEAIAKISQSGWHLYWQDGWNKLSFIILLIALPSIIDPFIANDFDTNILLAIRALNILKPFKLFTFIPNIHSLIRGLKIAIRSSCLVCLAYFVFILVCSIITSTLFGTSAPKYFGDPLISFFYIFRLFTLEGWYEIPEAIASSSGLVVATAARIYFSVLIFIGGVLGMSLINSIFVDAMMSDNNDEVMKKLDDIEEQLRKLSEKQ